MNGSIREKIAQNSADNLLSILHRLIEGVIDVEELQQGIEHARDGQPKIYTSTRGERVLVIPAGNKRACAIVAPASLSTSDPKMANGLLGNDTTGYLHELSNALGAIQGWVRLASEGTRVDEALELIDHTSQTAWSITREMLGKRETNGPLKLTITDLSEFVDELVRLLRPKSIQTGVSIEQRVEPGLSVHGRRDMLWTVLWNPMINAMEAMTDGGNLLIDVTSKEGQAIVVIEDDGPGMKETMVDRIFEPYITTKNGGSGLGMAMVNKTLQEIGGVIEISSLLGQGTRVTIRLPLKTDPRVFSDHKKEQIKNNKTSFSSGVFYTKELWGRILVVDDDPAMRDMMFTALSTRGADVVAVQTPSQAMAQEGFFDLALVDMKLPEKSGDQLLSDLRRANKIRYALIVSGSESVRAEDMKSKPDGVMRKPFQLEDLFERVRSFLVRQNPETASQGKVV